MRSLTTTCAAAALAVFIFLSLLSPANSTRQINRARTAYAGYQQAASHEGAAQAEVYWKKRAAAMRSKGADTLQIAGSSLPDCAHACGSCSPCRLVMVSFVCSSLEEAETCPIAYKCMCNNKSYPVP